MRKIFQSSHTSVHKFEYVKNKKKICKLIIKIILLLKTIDIGIYLVSYTYMQKNITILRNIIYTIRSKNSFLYKRVIIILDYRTSRVKYKL